jgi:hypothetical protein
MDWARYIECIHKPLQCPEVSDRSSGSGQNNEDRLEAADLLSYLSYALRLIFHTFPVVASMNVHESLRTATPADEVSLAFMKGHHHQGVMLTQTQVDRLYAFYGFDRKATSQRVAESKKLAEDSYQARVAEWGSEYKNRLVKPKPPVKHDFDAKGAAAFFDAGDHRNLFRHVTHDALRIMAFLAPFLQKGEDPVKLVAQLCIDAGYDVGYEVVDWLEGACEDSDEDSTSQPVP